MSSHGSSHCVSLHLTLLFTRLFTRRSTRLLTLHFTLHFTLLFFTLLLPSHGIPPCCQELHQRDEMMEFFQGPQLKNTLGASFARFFIRLVQHNPPASLAELQAAVTGLPLGISQS